MDDFSERRGHGCKDGMMGRDRDRLFYRQQDAQGNKNLKRKFCGVGLMPPTLQIAFRHQEIGDQDFLYFIRVQGVIDGGL
jgi:hypothetical protein